MFKSLLLLISLDWSQRSCRSRDLDSYGLPTPFIHQLPSGESTAASFSPELGVALERYNNPSRATLITFSIVAVGELSGSYFRGEVHENIPPAITYDGRALQERVERETEMGAKSEGVAFDDINNLRPRVKGRGKG